jgi:hypothetical protein
MGEVGSGKPPTSFLREYSNSMLCSNMRRIVTTKNIFKRITVFIING